MALRFGEVLVEKGFISAQQLAEAVKEQRQTKEMLGQILIRRGLISERDLLMVLAEQQGLEFVDLKQLNVPDHVIKSVPARFVWHYKVMPISIQGDVLTVATSDPFDVWAIDDLETNLNLRVEKVLALRSDIEEAIHRYYGVGADTIENILSSGDAKERNADVELVHRRDEDLDVGEEDASVVKLVNQILEEAIKARATDIHFERAKDGLHLRYRVDGLLRDVPVSDDIKYLYPSIVSRIKVLSSLDIVERRMPQDGRAVIKPKSVGGEYDLRISVMPSLYGENIVIRLLPKEVIFDISDLGMSEEYLAVLESLLRKPYGVIFATGPTGSGKSTTLYACLSRINTRDKKIVTIEDPVEYELNGVTQTQVNVKIGLTFARILRSMLRHDPDVIMVGEVRDIETAEITIQTALTGHLVFSTLHTNDAAGGVSRLIDMGIDPFLITSSVEAFMAQRLVRKICEQCKEKVRVSKVELGMDIDGVGDELEIFRGRGCRECNNTGYKGRTGIYEILLVSDEIKRLITQKASSDVIRECAVKLGMKTVRQSGWEKVLAGITTPEEVIRVTQVA